MEPAGGATRSTMHRRAEWLAAGVLVFVTAAALFAVALAAIHATQPVPDGVRSPASTAALFALIELAFAGTGLVLVRRRAAPAIGWLLLAVAAVDALNRIGEYWSAAAVVARPGSLPGGYGMAWLDGATEHAVPVLLAAVVLCFPTGWPPTRAWCWPWWLLAAGALVAGVARALQPGDLRGVPFPADNPIGWAAADDHLDVLQTAGALVLLAGIVGCLLSLVPRWLGATERGRLQLSALALVGLIVAVVVPVVPVLPDPFTVLYAVAMAAFPVVVGLAILEVRLDEVDRALRRTLAAFLLVAMLAAALAAVYVVIVGGGGALLGRSADPWLVLAAVVVLVALARPAWRAARGLADRLVSGPRPKPSEVLADFTLEAGAPGDGLLDRLAEIVADGTGATAAEVWTRHGEELSCDGSWPRSFARDGATAAATIAARVPLAIASPAHTCPVERDGQLLGALAVRVPPAARWREQDDELLRELAAAAALVLENERLISDLRASRERLVEAQDAERRRLERDLHDGAQQRILALVIDLRRRRSRLAERGDLDHAEAAALLDHTADELQAAVDELRDLARGIHPAILTSHGLAAALRSLADRAPLPVTVVAPVGRLPDRVESTAYFVACESLANAVRHGGATQVSIAARVTCGRLVLEVTDDGLGGARPGVGTGLTGLDDRVGAVGGTFSVTSRPGVGTQVRAELPCASS